MKMHPNDYLKKHGLVGYSDHYKCIKNHKDVDYCIKHEFKCTIHLKEYLEIEKNALVYDRDTLVTVLVYHYMKNNASCGCGWAELGKSYPEHVVDIYEESISIKGD